MLWHQQLLCTANDDVISVKASRIASRTFEQSAWDEHTCVTLRNSFKTNKNGVSAQQERQPGIQTKTKKNEMTLDKNFELYFYLRMTWMTLIL